MKADENWMNLKHEQTKLYQNLERIPEPSKSFLVPWLSKIWRDFIHELTRKPQPRIWQRDCKLDCVRE